MNSNKDIDLDKIISKNDKLELDKLDKCGDFLNSFADINDMGSTLSCLAFLGVLFYNLYFESLPFMYKIVIGLICHMYPVSVWAIKFMNINVNFTVSDSMLIMSSLVLVTRLIECIVDILIANANEKVDMILSKYTSDNREDTYDEE